jgi:uncharacterized membrane protein
MHCMNCGQEVASNVKFCGGCGSPIPAAQGDQATAQAAPVVNEAQDNKVIFILSYILFFLPLISCPESKVGRFHANQGLVLLITSVAGHIALSILNSIILAISWRLWAITSLLSWIWVIAISALAIIGMINANKGEQKPLPIIGGITILK